MRKVAVFLLLDPAESLGGLDSAAGPALQAGRGSQGVVLKAGDLPAEKPAEGNPRAGRGFLAAEFLLLLLF